MSSFQFIFVFVEGQNKKHPFGCRNKNKNAPDADAYNYSYFEKLLKEGIRVLIRKFTLFLSKSILVIFFCLLSQIFRLATF